MTATVIDEPGADVGVGVLARTAATAINCFTGSLAQVSSRQGFPIDEAQLLEAGDGYLYRAGVDEGGMPEYTFSVEAVGLRGCASLGGRVEEVGIAAGWRAQLRGLLAEHPSGVVVWVNSSFLDYAPVYASRPGYLHAVIATGMDVDGTRVRVLDSLIVDREPYGCDAWLDAIRFERALFERVRTELHDHMGRFMVLACAPRADAADARTCLLRQTRQYIADDGPRGALRSYAGMCASMFDGEPSASARAARRLFDHISVLYVLPGLALLQSSARRAGASDVLVARIAALAAHWRALSLLALKFEATGSAAVRARIDERFAVLEDGTHALWQALHDELVR